MKAQKPQWILPITFTLLIIAAITILILNKERNYWKGEFVKLENSCNAKLNCVNSATILSPKETKESLLELVKRVRNNCF